MNDSEKEVVFAACGGRPVTRGGERGWWFGSNPSKPDTTSRVVKAFDASEPLILTGPKVILTDYAKLLFGKHPPYSWQQTGSCVNSGAWNTLVTRHAIDAAVGPDPLPFALPFTLPAYGLSRKLAFGRDDEGEGSSGDEMAQALQQLGSTQYDLKELAGVLPVAKVYDIALTYTAEVEMRYSAAHNCPAAVADQCKRHTIEYVKITSLDEAESELRKLRPFTIAGNWGSRMQMQYRGTGANRVLFGDYADSWEHQMSCHGVAQHPELGRLWLIMQNWYMIQGSQCLPVHGEPGEFADVPRGTFWVQDEMIQHQLSYRWGELRSIKSLKGYDQGKLNHMGV
jgi:hypothetical protein